MRWVMLLALMVTACGADESASQKAMHVWVGKNMADVVVGTLDGEIQPFADLMLAEDMGGSGGKPVLLNVAATWCPPCVQELPDLDALGKSGQAKVIVIMTDKNAQTVKDFLRDKNYGRGFTVWFDSQGIVTREKLGALALPVSYVLDSSLTITRVEAGPRAWGRGL
ncbi:MAG: TlpA disulfide reductase family protein [Alphaproteobacteria bacterium]